MQYIEVHFPKEGGVRVRGYLSLSKEINNQHLRISIQDGWAIAEPIPVRSPVEEVKAKSSLLFEATVIYEIVRNCTTLNQVCWKILAKVPPMKAIIGVAVDEYSNLEESCKTLGVDCDFLPGTGRICRIRSNTGVNVLLLNRIWFSLDLSGVNEQTWQEQ